jgi:GNAT superfamily N-acetyltransferase
MHARVIRRIELADLDQIIDLINVVVFEQYGHLLSGNDIKIDSIEIPTNGWIALVGDRIAGVGIAERNSIDDLWLLPEFRRLGTGTALLAAMETQIRDEGHALAKLRVVAENQSARNFYVRRGWKEGTTYPHEKWDFMMVDFSKDLNVPQRVA